MIPFKNGQWHLECSFSRQTGLLQKIFLTVEKQKQITAGDNAALYCLGLEDFIVRSPQLTQQAFTHYDVQERTDYPGRGSMLIMYCHFVRTLLLHSSPLGPENTSFQNVFMPKLVRHVNAPHHPLATRSTQRKNES